MSAKPQPTVIYRGIGTGTLLGVLFVTLKLCGVVTWPWVWVLAPFWIPWGLTLLFVLALLVFALGVLAVAFLVAWLDK